ncbi:MAG: V-type ATP synthase subunit D [Planctomycetaceae bacterium]|nr:V-type ATP synthase subunit D [Planctomycetales bacterium]MCB9921072.1 V-type ATP synthase subunit D [Planctomycetaceae bacterium]
MALALNKTALKQQRDHLEMYQRFLPSLDLKRQQLIADYQRARGVLASTQREIDELMTSQEGLFRLLGASEQDLRGLICVESVESNEENLLGVRLPRLGEVRFHATDYSMLAKPFWVDFLMELLRTMATLSIRRDVEQERVRRLNEAVRRITQRVNLFEKVLIPQAEKDIQRIRIYLADAERAAVVRSKIAKAKQQRAEINKRVV